MGLFDRLFGSKAEKEIKAESFFRTLNAYTPVFTNWRGSIYESELVRSAINARALHFSKMEVEMIGAAKPVLQTRMRLAPNEFQTWSQFLYRTCTILDIHNTAYIVPVIDRYDDTTGIAVVLPTRCEFVQHHDVPYIRYHFANGDTAAIELERCGILTKYQYKDDLIGDSNTALDSTMALIDIQNQGIKEGVKSAATYRFMAQLSNFSKAEDLAKERKRFTDENLKVEEGNGGLLLFPNTYSNIKQIEAKPWTPDAEQMKLINTNVYNYFGVNEAIMQNSAGAEDLDAFYNGALEPLAIQLSEVLTKMLYSQRERGTGNYVRVTSNRLQYMSPANKLALLQTMGDRGMLTINEGRALLNYPPVDGGGEMMPIRGEYYDAKSKEGVSEDE